LATSFTNSASRFQYYNLANLGRDIKAAMRGDLRVLHLCSEPWEVADLHEALLGTPFANDGPPVVSEDMRTEYAGLLGRNGPYLYNRAEVLGDLKRFCAEWGR
jgi:hypothetical protein